MDTNWIWLGLVALVVVLLVGLFNSLVRGRLGVREAWSAVDVQLQRRLDLVPNLVETVKGYARHERETFDDVVRARNEARSARTPGEASAANTGLSQALGGLLALAEAYPQLRASENFKELQGQLDETEDKIAYARNYYNARVLSYNAMVQTIPAALFAGMFGFAPAEFFEGDEAARQAPRVSFDAGKA